METGNEQDRFHSTIETIHRFTRPRNLKSQQVAAEMAVTIYARKLHGNKFNWINLIFLKQFLASVNPAPPQEIPGVALRYSFTPAEIVAQPGEG